MMCTAHHGDTNSASKIASYRAGVGCIIQPGTSSYCCNRHVGTPITAGLRRAAIKH